MTEITVVVERDVLTIRQSRDSHTFHFITLGADAVDTLINDLRFAQDRCNAYRERERLRNAFISELSYHTQLNNKINLIKTIRDKTGCTLMDANDIVETLLKSKERPR